MNKKKEKSLIERIENKKIFGFTLIELLAVIIILGVLMIIAIPSVTEYISSSRKSAYITTAGQFISGARTKINAAEIPMYDVEATYYVPTSCIHLEKGGSSPFGEIEEGYIVVTYDGHGYDYYFTVRDSSKQGILLTDDELLDTDRIITGLNDINEFVAIEGREKILIVQDCGSTFAEYPALDTIPENGKLDEIPENVAPPEPTPEPDPEPEPEPEPEIPISVGLSLNRNYDTAKLTVNLSNVDADDYSLKIDYYIKLASDDDSLYVKKSSQTITSGVTNSYTYNDVVYSSSYMLKVVVTDSKGGSVSNTITAGTWCFLAGTQVLTESGLKNIEDIKIGEYVYSINMDTNERELKRVTYLYKGETDEIYEITIGDEVIKTTPKHEFYIVDKGWIRAYDLEVGDRIVSTGEEAMIITEIVHKKNQDLIPVYNITVEGNHNYLVTKYRLLVHNAPSPT